MSAFDNEDHRHAKAFVYGAGGFLILDFAFRIIRKNWLLLIAVYAVLKVVGFFYFHFFTPMTTDLSSYIGEQYKKLQIVSIEGEYTDTGTYSDEYDRDHQIHRMWLTIHNGAEGRVKNAKLYCDGSIALQPPDKSYAPVVKETHDIQAHLLAMDIAPGETRRVQASMGFDLEGDKDHLKCRIVSADFVDQDIYRIKGETDYQGLSHLKDTLSSTISARPIAYHGEDYPIIVAATIKNTGDKVLHGVDIKCLLLDRERDVPEFYQSHATIEIKPGEATSFKHNVPFHVGGGMSDASRYRAMCWLNDANW